MRKLLVDKKPLTITVKAFLLVFLTLLINTSCSEEREPEHNEDKEHKEDKEHQENKAHKEQDDAPMDFFKSEPDTAYPDTSPLLVNAHGRDYQSLNGLWNMVVDEAGLGWRAITKGEYFDSESAWPETGRRLLELSFDSRKQLRVPGDWNSQIPELERYRNRLLYQKAVELAPEKNKRYFLHFGGANYTADLFVNNQLVGRHIGGYTSFNFDISDFLQDGKNTFIVRVNAHLDESTVPTMRTSDFWKYGGLIGDVGLITLPATYLSQYHIYLNDLDQREIRGWVRLAGARVGGRKVGLTIPQAGIEVSAVTDSEGRAEFRAIAKTLKLWSPESPNLNEVVLAQGDETIEDRIGFRTIATDGLNILLNGKPVRLRGISLHEETVLHPGIATSRDDAQANFKLVKELNANYVRLAHYPHNEHTLKLADEMGLMVWSEVPIVSLIDWENPDTLSVAKSQVTENITRDMNRAAIIMWSISNESFPQSQARLDFLTALADTARGLDASRRPIASALVGGQGEEFRQLARHLLAAIVEHPELSGQDRQRLLAMAGKAAGAGADAGEHKEGLGDVLDIAVKDPLGKVVDIAGYNEYFGWYYAKHMALAFQLDEMLVRDAMIGLMPNIRFSNPYGKPMVISEFGAGAKYGLRSKEGLLWSEEYQARVYRAQLAMLEKSPYVQGFSPWVLKDFRSHLRELNGIQDGYNRKGLVSETGEKKLAFKVLADYYRTLMTQ